MAKRKMLLAEVSMNLTPMIDVTFQLIIFFILCSQIASEALSTLELVRPAHSQAIPPEKIEAPDKIIVNVVPLPREKREVANQGEAWRYEINGKPFTKENQESLVEAISSAKSRCKEPDKFYIEIRSDKSVRFGDVQPVMLAAASAKIVKMNITALTMSGTE